MVRYQHFYWHLLLHLKKQRCPPSGRSEEWWSPSLPKAIGTFCTKPFERKESACQMVKEDANKDILLFVFNGGFMSGQRWRSCCTLSDGTNNNIQDVRAQHSTYSQTIFQHPCLGALLPRLDVYNKTLHISHLTSIVSGPIADKVSVAVDVDLRVITENSPCGKVTSTSWLYQLG